MPKKSINILKSYFETGDRPTESQFSDLIDSFLHKDNGRSINSISQSSGNINITFNDGEVFSFSSSLPESEEISFINGLQDALDSKVDKEAGKSLTSNDFTNELKTKLDNLQPQNTSEEISFINGLQDALDSKANNTEVVKFINYNGTQYGPDQNGLVNIINNNQGLQEYNISFAQSFLNYTYFNSNVYGILIPKPPDNPSNEFLISHNLGIETYLKVEFWLNGLPTNARGVEVRRDAAKAVDDVSGEMELSENSINFSPYSGDFGDFIYIEYTIKEVTNEVQNEGISSDAVGGAAVGEDSPS